MNLASLLTTDVKPSSWLHWYVGRPKLSIDFYRFVSVKRSICSPNMRP